MLPGKAYTFDNFITGEWNRFAYRAAKAVAENPGSYNPLFLYGGSSLGKTHLLGAIYHYICEHAPGKVILMFPAEELVQELVRAVKSKQETPWYADLLAADVLLIDDMHDLEGKHATQDAFVSLLRSFAEQGKQVVMASSMAPGMFPVLDASFRVDFERGLIADIRTPDMEESFMLADGLAARGGFSLTEEELDIIASEACGDVRKIKGLITRLEAERCVSPGQADSEEEYFPQLGMSIMTPAEIEATRKEYQHNMEEAHRIAQERWAREREEQLKMKWRYYVTATIVNDHSSDINIAGKEPSAFPPGAKVYITKNLRRAPDEVTVMGLARSDSRYILARVPLHQLENIRSQRISEPSIKELMCDNTHHGLWWVNSESDKLDTQIYAKALQVLSSPFEEPDAEWLYVSADGTTLLLCPYAGRAWETGKQIIASCDNYSHPYMNGYCWSSMVKYYLRSIKSSRLIHGLEIDPQEHVCIFQAQEPDSEAIVQLSNILRKDVSLLPAWIIESQFDDWDDW